jgi:asparagine synthase (glutamine-hydrolysing)
MCGIAGIFRLPSARGLSAHELGTLVRTVAHRGPDGEGLTYLGTRDGALGEVTAEGDWTVGLGHRRLSILDLSESGRQPMQLGDQPLWISFNGEIYNYLELRAELEALGQTFRSHSDTEVILGAYAAWGTAGIARLRGMWGFMLVDGRRRVAVLSRDRLGIKPLYYRAWDDRLAVGSELKQLLALPGVTARADERALTDYLATGYEDPSRTFFDGLVSLPAGTYAELSLDTLRLSSPASYWAPERVQVTVHDTDEAAARLRHVLAEATRIHLRSDVPVGCALSGGLDSSAVVVLVDQLNRREATPAPLHTFTATFPGEAIDERRYVEDVLRVVRAEPHYVQPDPQALLAELDRFTYLHDEPVGSASQYAGWCVARTTREAGVPVTLNGQGGDEVLSGYWQSYMVSLQDLVRQRRPRALGSHLLGALLPGGNPELVRQLPVMGRRYLARRRATGGRVSAVLDMSPAQRRVYEIRTQYLPRLLKWDDRNFMAFSVEGRYPFLDHELIDTVLSFAPGVLYAHGWTKEPLRRGLADLLPSSIARRRSKLGFETPQGRWLRGALRPVVEAWLAGDSPLWARVSRDAARAHAARVWGHTHGVDEDEQAVVRWFFADRWMRVFDV